MHESEIGEQIVLLEGVIKKARYVVPGSEIMPSIDELIGEVFGLGQH